MDYPYNAYGVNSDNKDKIRNNNQLNTLPGNTDKKQSQLFGLTLLWITLTTLMV